MIHVLSKGAEKKMFDACTSGDIEKTDQHIDDLGTKLLPRNSIKLLIMLCKHQVSLL